MGSYEGPLPTAGLLANANDGLGGLQVRVGAEQWVEEVVINEAMEMNSVLVTLARLPRTLKRLDIRIVGWVGGCEL